MERTSSSQRLEVYSKSTKDIQIEVVPEFLERESDVEQSAFAFAYTVTIRNNNQHTVKLINRHWIVLSGGKQIADVKGEGVVGQQPTLRPGEEFEYTSGTMIVDSVGSMHGTYTFQNEVGEFFDVSIPSFNLYYMTSDAIH